MLNFKLIASDLDDTLLRPDLTISPRIKEAVRKAREAGVIFTIATGRMFCATLPFARELEVDVPLLTYQGALVKSAVSGEVFVDRPLPLELAREVIARGYREGLHINVYLDDKLFVDHVTEDALGYARQSGVEMHPVGNLLEFINGQNPPKDPTKILYIATPEVIDHLAEELKSVFGEQMYITKSKPYYLEFLHPQATKGQALAALGDIFNIKREEMIAIGDSYNDLEMIEYAGLGVVMGNARDEIKKHADVVAPSNEEDGVAWVIKKFCLGDEI